MENIKKSLFVVLGCLFAVTTSAKDVTFTMGNIFDGSNQSAELTTPTAATVTTTSSKSNAKDGKLGSDGNYFQIVLASETFTAASMSGYINTTSTEKNWGFQFSTDKGATWGTEQTQANDGNKTEHEIGVSVSIPSGANGFRVIRRAGTSTVVKSITLTISGGGDTPSTPVAVTGVTLNKSTLSLKVGANETLTATVSPSNADNKSVSWASDKTNIATVDQNGKVTAVAVGTATITVTTADGGKTATCTVTVTSSDTPDPDPDPTPDPDPDPDPTPVPQTDLTTHEPEIYEAKTIAGGYNTPLTVFGGREYEVYYINRDGDNLSVSTTNVDKSSAITNSSDKQNAAAKDGWFTISSSGSGGDTNASQKDEFKASIRSVNMKEEDEILLHVKGFDQFSFYGKDNGTDKDKYFHVYIDNVQQTTPAPNNSYAVRRYDITTGEHVIKIAIKKGVSSSSKFTSFSLRVAQEPRVSKIKGNDTTQLIRQTDRLTPITYFTKYNSKGETKVIWEGSEAKGIELKKVASSSLGDTLSLGGNAMCATGEYKFRIVSLKGGVETRSIPGTFTVYSEIKAQTDTDATAYTGEPMDPITYRYYALNAKAVTLSWKDNNAPAGIAADTAKAGFFTISGSPTTEGTYIYTVTIEGGNSVSGTLKIQKLDMGNDPVMFLYKTGTNYESDPAYTYLKDQSATKRNLVARKTQNSLRDKDTYAKYKWILISEDVDADNEEVLGLIRGNVNLPVLNMKAFTYGAGRVTDEGWGEADNGSRTANGRKLTVQRADHPIFKSMNKKQGDQIEILADSIARKGLMPIRMTNCNGSYCLATATTRSIEDYNGDGVQQTFLHEIPANSPLRNSNKQKYICLPIAMNSSSNPVKLTNDGKKLLDAVVKYLTSSETSGITLPELAIKSFMIEDVKGVYKQGKEIDSIIVKIDISKYPDIDLSHLSPVITLADPTYSHVTPASQEEYDFSQSYFAPVIYTVSDYIHRKEYAVKVTTFNPQGIDETYVSGEWVNIYDIYGRLLTTTNEDIYTMNLPRGIYLIVTNNGSFKILR